MYVGFIIFSLVDPRFFRRSECIQTLTDRNARRAYINNGSDLLFFLSERLDSFYSCTQHSVTVQIETEMALLFCKLSTSIHS
jgi:hypothetical protein